MRNELKNIENIERYLMNEMSADGKNAFENELAANEKLREQVKVQDLLQKAVARKALRAEIKGIKVKGFWSGNGKWWVIGGVGLLILTASLIFFSENNDKHFNISEKIESQFQIKIDQSKKKAAVVDVESEVDVLPVDSVENYSETSLLKKTLSRKEGVFGSSSKQKAIVNFDEQEIKDNQLEHFKTEELSENIDSLVDEKFKINDFKSPVQKFQIDNFNDTTICGEYGSVLQFPANCLVTSKAGKVEVRLREFLTNDQIIIEGLSTKSNGEIIETAGMIHVEVFQNGRKIDLKPDEFIRWANPMPEDTAGFIMFNGEKIENEVNWIAQKTAVKTDAFETFGMRFNFYAPKNSETTDKKERAQLLDDILYQDGSEFNNSLTTISQNRDIPYIKMRGTVNPITYTQDGYKIHGNFEKLILYYDQLLDNGVLPVGYLTFSLNKKGQASDFNYRGELNVHDLFPFIDSLKQFKEWEVTKSGLFDFSKDGFAVLNLSYLRYMDYPEFKDKIKDLIVKNNIVMDESGPVDVFKVFKLGYVNCDRFVRSNKVLKDFEVKANPYGKTMLIYKSIRSFIHPIGNQGSLTFKNVPLNEAVFLVTLLETHEGISVIREDLNFNGKAHEMGQLKDVSKVEFEAFLKSLNKIRKPRIKK